MTPNIDPALLRDAPKVLTAMILAAEASKARMKGTDNRADQDHFVQVLNAAVEFHHWAMKELVK